MASSKTYQPWVPFDKVDSVVQIEPALFVVGLALGVILTSKLFFRRLSGERQTTLSLRLKNLGYHVLLGASLFIFYQMLDQIPSASTGLERLLTYLGLATIFSGCTIFVKACRILAFDYFYVRHRNVAFPVLLVNLFTLFLVLMLVTWLGTEIFNIQLAPMLATSAVLSLVLGLALQDTLGNLFAGVTLQFDKPYEIGDWIEVHSDGHKWVGEVSEISWRSTALIAFSEETIIVPNRVMAQAKISNYSVKGRPITRSHIFKLPFGTDIKRVKEVLIQTAETIPQLRKNRPVEVFISDTTESWIGFKLIYFIDHFGRHFRIADQVYSQCLAALEKEGFKLATHRVTLESKAYETTE